MAFLAVAQDCSAEELLASSLDHLQPNWSMRAVSTPWGALVIAGAQTGTADDWLVLGEPQADPWGRPGRPVAREIVAAAFDRFGPSVVQRYTGPFLAVRMTDGAVVRPLSGIVPLYASADAGIVATLASVAGENSVEISRGGLVERGVECDVLRLAPADEVATLTWHGVRDELTSMGSVDDVDAASLTVGPSVGAHGHVSRHRPTGMFIWEPPLPDDVADYSRLAHELPLVWLAARCSGEWLLAPMFERPARDLVLSVGYVT